MRARVDTVMENLKRACHFDLDTLPTWSSDLRGSALYAWLIAYYCEDYDRLPIYWHKAVGTLLLGLRMLRVDAGLKSRSPEVTAFSIAFLEYLWEMRTRSYIYWHSSHCWAHSQFDGQLCYDMLWTVWEAVKDVPTE